MSLFPITCLKNPPLTILYLSILTILFFSCKSKDIQNIYESDSSLGEYGGACTCPNGETYQVAAYENDCTKLACNGGTFSSAKCEKSKGDWSNKKVTCSPINPGFNCLQYFNNTELFYNLEPINEYPY